MDLTVIQRSDKVDDGEGVRPPGPETNLTGDAENAISSTTPNNDNIQIPPSSSSLDFGPTSNEAHKEVARTETITGSDVPTHKQGTPGQQPSPDPGTFIPTAQGKEVSGHYPTICATHHIPEA